MILTLIFGIQFFLQFIYFEDIRTKNEDEAKSLWYFLLGNQLTDEEKEESTVREQITYNHGKGKCNYVKPETLLMSNIRGVLLY